MELTENWDERAVAAAARDGDQGAFALLVKAYQRKAYAAAYGMVGNREDALDIAQEAFARAFRAMRRFDPEMPFYPWLYRIIRNLAYNHLKRRQRRGEQSLEALHEEGFDVAAALPKASDQAERSSLRGQIRTALAELSPEHREILQLRHFSELSYAEIAACLKVPQGTVMSRLHAARKRLAQVLEEQAGRPVNEILRGAV
jgi:RNA polymerase sigma-70 factor (ECF subfamily)